MKRYHNIYQRGGYTSDIGPIYRQRLMIQRGKGLSDFFKGIFKYLGPIMLNSGKALTTEALRSGNEIMSSIGNKPIQEILKEQSEKSIKNLVQKSEEGLKKMRGGKTPKKRQVKKLINKGKSLNNLINQLALKGVKSQNKTSKKKQAFKKKFLRRTDIFDRK